MEQTSQYQFSQWAETDRIQREDFNADNFKAEQALAELATQAASAGNCKIVTGSYTGTDTYGSSNPCTLTFPGKPMMVFVGGSDFQFTAVRGATRATAAADSQNDVTQFLTWGETTLSWYYTKSSFQQLNYKGYTYHYVALLLTDA